MEIDLKSVNVEITSQVFVLSSEKHISVHSKVKEIWVQSYILHISHYLFFVCDDTCQGIWILSWGLTLSVCCINIKIYAEIW